MIRQHDRQHEVRRGMRADHLSGGRTNGGGSRRRRRFFFNYLKLKENTIPVHYKIFPIPVINPVEQEDALKQFLCTHKIISIHKEIAKENSGQCHLRAL
jgi:hypothetical protein